MKRLFTCILRAHLFALGFLAATGGVQLASAQQSRGQELETRASLTERAARAERAGQRALAAYIRARLVEGDFQEGDRVVIVHENPPPGRGDPAMSGNGDTLIVRGGRVLQFPQGRYQGVKDLSVAGLLHSELPAKVHEQFSVIYRDPILRVTSLVALNITGSINRGGIVDVPPDMRLNDVFTQAGGLTNDADAEKIFVRRGMQEFMTAKQLQEALNNSLTVDAAHLRAYDQIIVPRKNPSNWLQYVGLGMSILTVAIALTRGGF